MPLVGPYQDPRQRSRTIPAAYAVCNLMPLNFREYTNALVYDIYADAESCYAGDPPLDTFIIPMRAEPTPAEYGQPEVLQEYRPPVYSEPDPETGDVTVLEPEVPPVLGPRPLVRAAVEGLIPFITANRTLFGQLRQACDAEAVKQPLFDGWAIVPSPFEADPTPEG